MVDQPHRCHNPESGQRGTIAYMAPVSSRRQALSGIRKIRKTADSGDLRWATCAEWPQRLMNTENYGLYAQPGYLLFMQEHSLMAQRFDANRLRLSGAPSLVASGVETALYNPGSGYVKTAIYSAGGAAVVFRKSPLAPAPLPTGSAGMEQRRNAC